MRKLLSIFFLSMAFNAQAKAALNVFACEPEWAALVSELAGDSANVFTATTATQDPHHIEARPSLIAKLRRADLLVCTGAELEAGWVPALLRQAGNAKVQPGNPGYFEAASFVTRLDVPVSLDRAQGDVHAGGNPHVHTDPRRLAQIAPKLAERLMALDSVNESLYRTRLKTFESRWGDALKRWTQRAAPLKGKRAVAYHKDWAYLYDWLSLKDAGTLEPKPGLPPTAAHLTDLKARLKSEPASFIILTPYQDVRPAKWLSEQTGARVVVLPYTVGGGHAKDLFSLFDETLAQLLAGTAP